jgi:hypothetical protein
MKKLLLILMMLSVTDCYSSGRGVASRVIENLESEDTRQCEIRGSEFGEVSERTSWECSPQFLKTLIM